MDTLCAANPETVKRTTLCTTLAGNACDVLTISAAAPQSVHPKPETPLMSKPETLNPEP